MKSNRLFFAFIIITAITSWFSVGFYQADEHFQILEPAAWKAGWISSHDLPWEFASTMRSSVEPTIAFLLIKALGVFKIENPFIVALLMRLISAIMSVTCFTLWRNHLKRSANSPEHLKWFDAALLLWFIPYMSVRFSAEIWGGCLFFISLALVYGKKEFTRRDFLLAGSIAALGFFIRFQTGLLIGGFLFVKIFNLKKNFSNLLWYCSGFILLTVMNVCLDHWFYQKWCFTPWNYFLEGINNKHAAEFGSDPFYFYFIKVFMNAFPLQGMLIIGVFIIYIAKKIRDEISVGILFFLAGHFITGHKELRFVFPLIFILPFMFSYSMQWITEFKFTKTMFFKVLSTLIIITNSIMLIGVAIKPADSQVALEKAIYNSVGNSHSIVLYENENPFSRLGLKMNFYKNKNMQLFPADSLPKYPTDEFEKILLVTSDTAAPKKYEENFQCVYQDIPEWILKLNLQDWVSKIKVNRVYEMKRSSVN